MECGPQDKDPISREIANQFDTLQKVVDELAISNYTNDEGLLICNPAFLKLTELAKAEQPEQPLIISNEPRYEDEQIVDEPFHIEADIYNSGDYAYLLVIPSGGQYIVVGDNEHLSTLVKTCEEPECWDQIDGSLDDEVVELLGKEFISNLRKQKLSSLVL